VSALPESDPNRPSNTALPTLNAHAPLSQTASRSKLLFRDNVIFEGERLTGILDFYFAGCDTWLYDIGVCLNDWCVDLNSGRHDVVRKAAFLAAYESVRRLLAQECRLLPAMERAAAFRFWLSRLRDLHMPRQAAVLKAHDPNHFECVLRHRVGATAEAEIL
jgi:homoserine kinase type II